MKTIVAMLVLVLTTNAHAYRFVGTGFSVCSLACKESVQQQISELGEAIQAQQAGGAVTPALQKLIDDLEGQKAGGKNSVNEEDGE